MRPALLAAVSAVLLLLSPCAASAAGHELSLAARVEKASVVVVSGSADHMEQVLARAKVEFVLVSPEDVAALPLNARQVVMVNCTGNLSAPGRERIQRFVNAGGFLYTTDHAVDQLIQVAFPNTIAWTDASTNEEIVPVLLHGKYKDRGLLAHLGGDAAEHWQLASGGHPFKVLDPKKVDVLMDSPEMAKRYGAGGIAARIHWGDGIIIHVTGHFDGQGRKGQGVAEAGRAFDQFSANVVQAKQADAPRIDALYGSASKREVTLRAGPAASAVGSGQALSSGARLNVLERKGGAAKVRDLQGNEGWVDADAL